MSLVQTLWSTPKQHLRIHTPDHPVLYFSPATLQSTARLFQSDFPGLVTYAVKANDTVEVLENLVAAGLRAFDVASPHEMDAVRAILPSAVLHYNNPVRSMVEIETAVKLGVASYAVDSLSEFEKLISGGVPQTAEIAVRLKLPVKGAAYDFGDKFGADADSCVILLKRVFEAGYRPAMTFHPGTQCADPSAWRAYIDVCADVARRSGVTLERLNVGGGYAAHRVGDAPDLGAIFDAIEAAVSTAFGDHLPKLVCEPGRAMVAESITLAARVKAIRDGEAVFLNDGIYGGLAEATILGNVDRIQVLDSTASPRVGQMIPRVVFGPTCDSLDHLPGLVPLPDALEEGDWILFHGLGAYSTATGTRFNGYGALEVVTTDQLA